MFHQLDMVLKLLPEYAERAASKVRASGELVAPLMGPLILPPIAPLDQPSCMCGACQNRKA